MCVYVCICMYMCIYVKLSDLQWLCKAHHFHGAQFVAAAKFRNKTKHNKTKQKNLAKN